MVYKIRFVLAGDFPFRGLTGRQQSFHVVKPEFRHAVVIRSVFVSRYGQAVALYQSAESRNPSADRAVDIFPVMKERLIRESCLLRDAVNKFDHKHPSGYEHDAATATTCRAVALGAYHLSMTTIHPECPDPDPSDRLVVPADAFLRRQEPDEEEDEEEDEGDRKKEDDDDDDTTDDSYSE